VKGGVGKEAGSGTWERRNEGGRKGREQKETTASVTAEESFYILCFDWDAYNAKLEGGAEITDEGVEEAFEVVADVSEGY
jgi:hypothetical protein